MKRLWQLTEKDLLAGSLTLARCDRCGGQGVHRQAVLAYDGDDLQEIKQELACDCRQRPAELWQRANLPPGRFDDLTLADLDWAAFEPPEAATFIQDYTDHLETWLAEGMGLTLTGNVGTGKTHAAVGLVKLACGLGIETRFSTMADLLGRIKATYDRDNDHRRANGERETDVLDELAAVPLLALDDLGTENPTAWARDRLYTLVNRRYLAQRPVIATTNLSPEELASRLGERTISRLCGATLVVGLRGTDHRERVKRQALRRIRAKTANLRVLPPSQAQRQPRV